MDDARKIENLIYTYANLLDGGDLDGVAELFRHGRIRQSPDAPADASVEGVEAVHAMYANSTRIYPNGRPRTRHLTTNVMIEVEDGADTATSRSTATVLQQTDTLKLQPIIVCHYQDSFQKIDGKWWFDTRVMDVDLIGDLSQHLLYELT